MLGRRREEEKDKFDSKKAWGCRKSFPAHYLDSMSKSVSIFFHPRDE